MDAIDILEKRIEALELQVFPADRTNLINNKSQSVTELLLQTQTMITSALSCRESITSILQYMHTINEYLDPTNGENELEVEAKRYYLLELYSTLKVRVQLISTLEDLIPFTDSSHILQVNEMGGNLENISVENLSIQQESMEVTDNVLRSLQQYKDITESIKILFAQLDKGITDLENTLQVK